MSDSFEEVSDTSTGWRGSEMEFDVRYKNIVIRVRWKESKDSTSRPAIPRLTPQQPDR